MSHIKLKYQDDELIWKFKPFRVYAPKDGYSFLMINLKPQAPDWWWKGVWKSKCPLKAQMFMWCLIRRKVPTCDRMKLRGLEGPGWCPLCKGNEETSTHLFLMCPFTLQPWRDVSSLVGFSFNWLGPSIEEAWRTWVQDHIFKNIKALPIIILWGVWIARNVVIFKDKASLPDIIDAQNLAILAHFPQGKDSPPPRQVVAKQIDFSRAWDFFMVLQRKQRSLWGWGSSFFFPFTLFQPKVGLGPRNK